MIARSVLTGGILVSVALMVTAAPATAVPVPLPPPPKTQALTLPWHTLRPSSRPVALRRAIRPLPVTYRFEGRRHTLDDFLRRSATQGFVVLDGQRIVAERYSSASPGTRFQSWSMAKSFTGTAVGIAVGEGRIRSIDDPVTRYVPELRGSGYAGVSIRNLLRMSSGIAWSESLSVPPVHAAASAGASIRDLARAQVRGWRPGSRFEYTSMNSFVLSWVVSRATGTPFHRYLEQKIWHPAGMAGRAYLGSDWHGADLGYCCVYSTGLDFARFGLLYLRDGRANGRQVVPRSWVRASTRPSAPFNVPPGETSLGYGLQWWLGGGRHGDFMASGLGGQKIYVSPRHSVVITKSTTFSFTTSSEELVAFRAVAAYVARTRRA